MNFNPLSLPCKMLLVLRYSWVVFSAHHVYLHMSYVQVSRLWRPVQKLQLAFWGMFWIISFLLQFRDWLCLICFQTWILSFIYLCKVSCASTCHTTSKHIRVTPMHNSWQCFFFPFYQMPLLFFSKQTFLVIVAKEFHFYFISPQQDFPKCLWAYLNMV